MDDLLGNGYSKPKVDPRDYPSVKCKKCGSILFDQKIVIKKVPGAIVGQAGKTMPVPLDIYVCAKCGTPLEEDVKAYKLEKELDVNELEKELGVNEESEHNGETTLIL